MPRETIRRISLWSGPRNVSTALMCSFAQRSDTKVFDEPLYAHYLKNSPAKYYHPGAIEILATMENDGSKVVEMMLKSSEKPVLFFKNMTHHILGLDLKFTNNIVNVLLTRDPKEMLPSFDKVIPNPKMRDVGYKFHSDLVSYFERYSIDYAVLDSKNLLLNPERVLKRLCSKIEIPFDKNMLQWAAGKIKEDGIWAEYWYNSIHKSVGFAPYSEKTEAFPARLIPLLKECKSHYERLLDQAIA